MKIRYLPENCGNHSLIYPEKPAFLNDFSANLLKMLQVGLNTGMPMNLILYNPYSSFIVSRNARNETHRDYLTIQELEQIRNKEISTLRMEIIRDIFIFACYTGLGYAELKKLNSTYIHQGNDGGKWIIIDQTTTDIRCRVPLLPRAIPFLLNSYIYI